MNKLNPSLSIDTLLPPFSAALERANSAILSRYPAILSHREPVHTMYGGGHLFRAGVAAKMGKIALSALEQYAPSPGELGAILGLTADLAATIYPRITEKLASEPIEDFRIDFEDGYGVRADEEEDGHARAAAKELAIGQKAGILPPFCGLRIKPLTNAHAKRAVRTLGLFLSTAVEEGGLPTNFVITLPKVTTPVQVETLAAILSSIEHQVGLEGDTIKIELMVETPQAIISPSGNVGLLALTNAAPTRCIAAHFGTYDYTASCDIVAEHQTMQHPACVFAKQVMQVAYAETGISLSDGATNEMPIGPHRAPKGATLTDKQRAENAEVVHHAWKAAYANNRASLVEGYYRGWDLHPAQLPIRYAAVYAFFLEGANAAAARLRQFKQREAQASLSGNMFDDAASARGLINLFARAENCGALTRREVEVLTAP